MEKRQKNRTYYFTYILVAVLFFVNFAVCFYPQIFTGETVAEWSIPQTKPSDMRVDGSTYYVSTPSQFLYAISRNSLNTIEVVGNIDFSKNAYPKITKSTGVTIHGNGYTLGGIDINSSDRIGLIAQTSSSVVIESLNLIVDIDNTASTKTYLGSFVGYSTGSVNIKNSIVKGTIDVTNSTSNYVGGFVGNTASKVEITNSLNYATINAKGASYTGGIIGYVSTTDANITSCANFGNIKGETGYVGGIVGYYSGSNGVSKCFNSGDITGTTGSIGGLFGYTSEAFTISSCYSTGDITGGNTSDIGGIAGYADSSLTIKNCYSSGKISSNNSGNPEYTTETLNQKIGAYKIFEELYTSYTLGTANPSTFPQFDTYNTGDGSGSGNTPTYNDKVIDGTIKVSKIEKINSINIPGLVGNNKATSTNSYFYSNINTSSSYDNKCTITIVLEAKGQVFDTIYLEVDSDNSMNTENKNPVPTRMKSIANDEVWVETVSNVLTFSKIPMNYFSDYIIMPIKYPIDKQGDCTVSVKTNGSIFYVYYPYYGYDMLAANYVWFYGVKPTISGNTLTIRPVMAFDLSAIIYDGKYSCDYVATEDKNQSCSITLPSPTEKCVGTKTNSTQTIKNYNFGSDYTTDSKINNGYPFLKDFYWAYSL